MLKDTEGYICQTPNEIGTTLKQLEDSIVSVWAGKGRRNTFETGLSVSGKLERHKSKSDQYRVIVSDGNYTYFTVEDVVSVGVKNNGFSDGAAAVIEITF